MIFDDKIIYLSIEAFSINTSYLLPEYVHGAQDS